MNTRWTFVALAALALTACGGTQDQASEDHANTSPTVSQPVVSETEIAGKMVGRWQRTDGGYVIEIKSASPDGKLDAAYFNPNPINVGRASWQNDGGRLMMLVELSDVNYPGSLYSLEFKPQGDMLSGTYFQAVEKATYQVEFSRLK